MHPKPRNKSAPNLAGPGALLEPTQRASSNGSPHLDYSTTPLFALLNRIESNQAEIRRLNTIDHLMLGDYAGIPAWHGDINPLPHNDDWWTLFKQLQIATTHNLYAAAHWILDTMERLGGTHV